jgi:hypothetical protein
MLVLFLQPDAYLVAWKTCVNIPIKLVVAQYL